VGTRPLLRSPEIAPLLGTAFNIIAAKRWRASAVGLPTVGAAAQAEPPVAPSRRSRRAAGRADAL